jgi:hypothetical protein
VQIAGRAKTYPINKVPLFIGKDRSPDCGRSGVIEPERAEVELTLANAMHQLDAEIVVAAFQNRLKPSITFVLDLMLR